MNNKVPEINFPGYKVPKDDEDYRYTKCFRLEEADEIREFFRHYGFVVVRDVLTEDECQATIDDIWSLCEKNTTLKREDPNTWGDWPANGIAKYGMPTKDPVFTKQALRNRQNPNVHRVFAILFETDDLIVSHDRYCLLRPTKAVAFPDGSFRDCSNWKSPGGIHLDMNIWEYLKNDNTPVINQINALNYDHLSNFIRENNLVHKGMYPNGLHVQAGVNLSDNTEKDGGFACVPGFVNHFEEYVKKCKIDYVEGPSIKFESQHWIRQHGIRVAMRAGSIVVWDQRTPHGGCPNNSDRIRAAQFIKMYPRQSPLQCDFLANVRQASLIKQIQKADFLNEVTPLGMNLFGLAQPNTNTNTTNTTTTNNNNSNSSSKNSGGRGNKGTRVQGRGW
eukprot:TRINITY_DN3603_c0_g1_i1.p1 TRINITY_DN3603_c0_g1~~TRINITY_DN3603_c0_g1_i1.p1  ORF type:complete len:391 (+),score=72.70 TRINITY_DN3603_c0_g1_i1:173-1345(+)